MTSSLIDFHNRIQAGDILLVRILGLDGRIASSSGASPVDGSVSIHMPFLGGVFLVGSQLFEAEHQIEQGLIEGGFFTRPLVNVTRVQLF